MNSNGLNLDGVLTDPDYRKKVSELYYKLMIALMELPCPTFACISGSHIHVTLVCILCMIGHCLFLLKAPKTKIKEKSEEKSNDTIMFINV